MTQICTCDNPDPFVTYDKGAKLCAKCGHWWMPEHGSRPVQPAPTRAEIEAVIQSGGHVKMALRSRRPGHQKSALRQNRKS